jgi:predicted RNase H-like HicB family nuclease
LSYAIAVTRRSIEAGLLRMEVDALKQQVQDLQEQINRGPISTFIATLAPEPHQLLKPIPVVICREDDAFVASFVDANVNATGDTETESLAILKEMITSAFDLYQAEEENLSPELQRQLIVLRQFVRAA